MCTGCQRDCHPLKSSGLPPLLDTAYYITLQNTLSVLGCGLEQALNDDEEQESILGDAAQLSGDVQGHVVTLQEAKQWTLRDIMRMRQVIMLYSVSCVQLVSWLFVIFACTLIAYCFQTYRTAWVLLPPDWRRRCAYIAAAFRRSWSFLKRV